MAKKADLKYKGKRIYPTTITDAVYDIASDQSLAKLISGFPTVTKKGRITLSFSDNTSYQFDVADISDLPYYYNEGEGIGNFDDLYYADATIVGEFDETESEAEEGESV